MGCNDWCVKQPFPTGGIGAEMLSPMVAKNEHKIGQYWVNNCQTPKLKWQADGGIGWTETPRGTAKRRKVPELEFQPAH
jgi:hypothetical protein